MDKLIEMTLDGRLTLVWLFVGWFAVVSVLEWRRNRRVSIRQNARKG